MRRLATLGSAVVLAGAGGCSLLVTTSGLSGDVGLTDGGDGSIATSGDAGLTDGASSDGPGPDAPVSETGAPSPCSTQHLFCDDFDTGGSSLGARWDFFRQNAGPIVLEPSTFASPPRALRATLTPGSGVRVSELRKVVTPQSATTRVDFDVIVEAPTGTFVELDPVGIDISPPPANFKNHGLAIAMYPTKTVLQYHASPVGGGATTAVETTFTLPTSKRVHVTMTVDYSAAQPIGTIALDGTPAAQVTMLGTTPSSLEVTLGLIYTEDATGTFTGAFDNVVVD
jgi:hypothetical protein